MSFTVWISFIVFVFLMLAIDLGVFHRTSHTISFTEAAVWSMVWVTLALLFNVGVYVYMGADAGLEFLSGYLIEKSLAVDNIFVFVIIFSYFRVPSKYQHKILFWGIVGALLMRGVMIWLGALLLHNFHWLVYVFGAFLLYSGYRMARHSEHSFDPEANPLVKMTKWFIPFSDDYDGDSFFTKRNGKWFATPLFLVLVVVEITDLIFAVDSIPAIFAITSDPFIVFTSNVFAILGLRAMYFLLAGVVEKSLPEARAINHSYVRRV